MAVMELLLLTLLLLLPTQMTFHEFHVGDDGCFVGFHQRIIVFVGSSTNTTTDTSSFALMMMIVDFA